MEMLVLQADCIQIAKSKTTFRAIVLWYNTSSGSKQKVKYENDEYDSIKSPKNRTGKKVSPQKSRAMLRSVQCDLVLRNEIRTLSN